MKNKAIGVFDSGLGGLTAVKELIKCLPNENIVYFGDTGRVPYGTRSKETIIKYAAQDARFLLNHNVKMIIAACGTVSSVASSLGEELPVKFSGVLEPTALACAKATKTGSVAVLGTSATINSHSYKKLLEQINPDIKVYEQDCPLFVPLVENGFTDKDDIIVKSVVERYVSQFKNTDVDTVILGCTHYPLLKAAIGEVVGENVKLIDSGRETALYTKKLLKENNLLSESKSEGEREFYVSDTPHNFEAVAGRFLGRDMKRTATRIDIEKY
ncbi:MAG: glutamate racemase [Ruminococcus sp.]|nr:glutamate racemase [Ruminococcus sp.]